MLDCTLATGAAHALAALVQLVSAEFSSSAVTMRFFSDSSSSHGLELRVINDAATSFFKLRMHDTAFRQFSIDSPTGLVDVTVSAADLARVCATVRREDDVRLQAGPESLSVSVRKAGKGSARGRTSVYKLSQLEILGTGPRRAAALLRSPPRTRASPLRPPAARAACRADVHRRPERVLRGRGPHAGRPAGEVFAELRPLSDDVVIRVGPATVEFEALGTNLSGRVSIDVGTEVHVAMSGNPPPPVHVKSRLLRGPERMAKLATNALLQVGPERPLGILFEVPPGADAHLFLAPSRGRPRAPRAPVPFPGAARHWPGPGPAGAGDADGA
eukprot:tig00020816_g14174.t1